MRVKRKTRAWLALAAFGVALGFELVSDPWRLIGLTAAFGVAALVLHGVERWIDKGRP